MKMFKEKTWQLIKVVLDGYIELFGVNILNYKWKRI